MIEHTPGPWRLDDPKHAHLVDDDYHCIDAGLGFRHKGSGFCISGLMYTADARLIASAPELLAALEAALECVIPDKLRAQIDAAVNKARGTGK